MRTNGGEAARDLIYSHNRNSRIVNWRAQNPLQFWRLTKEEYRVTEGVSDRLDFLRDCAKYRRSLPLCELVEIYRSGGGDLSVFFGVLDLLPNEQPAYVLRYMKRNSSQYFSFYRDYLEAAAAVGRDLTVHRVAFPKNLIAAHDEAVAARQWIENAKKRADWEKKAKRYRAEDKERRKLYDFSDDSFFVRVAKDGLEIVAEGNALHHCVGGYVDRHLTCQTTILFLRRTDAPCAPLYTVEMRGDQLQQVHGDHNCDINGEAKVFFDRWLEWVKAGGGLAKQNKQTSAKVQTAERKAV